MNDPAMGDPKKRLTLMRYDVGPMGFLSDQIRKELQHALYPATEYQLYRSPAQQAKALAKGNSKARAFQSAHQYYGASDIVHEKWYWFAAKDAPDGTQFWDRLWDCVEVVSLKHDVEFSPRISWDPAHVQLANWREMKRVVGLKEPNQTQLDWYFKVTLPKVWKQYTRSEAFKERSVA